MHENMNPKMDEAEPTQQHFTNDDLVKLKELFEELDEDNKGFITSDKVRTCAQLLGQNPTDNMVENVLDNTKLIAPGQLQFDECRRVMEAITKPKEEIEDDIGQSLNRIIQSLKSSDGDVFSKEEFKQFLQARGDEPLLQEEIDDLFNDIDPEGTSEVLTKSQLHKLLTTKF